MQRKHKRGFDSREDGKRCQEKENVCVHVKDKKRRGTAKDRDGGREKEDNKTDSGTR